MRAVARAFLPPGARPPSRPGTRRILVRLSPALVVAAWLVSAFAPFPLAGQESGEPDAPPPGEPRAVFAVVPDTVRVGETFVLGVAVRADSADEVRFPEELATGEFYEQRAPVDRERPEENLWRADYVLVPWRADPGPLPALEVEVGREGAFRGYRFQPPEPLVPSVLPAEADPEELELRPPRPFLEGDGIPWLLILLIVGLLLGLILWLILRARAETRPREDPGEKDVERTPLERARAGLEELANGAGDGALSEPEFYDRLEEILREYAEATRGWPPGVPLRHLADGDPELDRVLRSSILSRFAGVEAGEEDRIRALQVCRKWLEEDR